MENAAESLLERARQAQEEGKRADARRNPLEAVSLLRQGGRRAELAKALRTLAELENAGGFAAELKKLRIGFYEMKPGETITFRGKQFVRTR